MRKLKFLGFGLMGLVMLAALGAVVMLLWNAVVPGLFVGARPLDYVHAVGLLALCRILFGGFRGRRGGFGGRHRRQWQARWEAMTPEERARFQQRGWGGGCGPGRGARRGVDTDAGAAAEAARPAGPSW